MDLTNAKWRKATRSTGNGGDCVEVAELSDMIAVRDSKDPDGGVLVVERAALWSAVGRAAGLPADR